MRENNYSKSGNVFISYLVSILEDIMFEAGIVCKCGASMDTGNDQAKIYTVETGC